MEAGCFFADERITDTHKVLAVLREVGKTTSREDFVIWPRDEYVSFLPDHVRDSAYIKFRGGDGKFQAYWIKDLYIVNGELMQDRWFFNKSLGHITVALEEIKDSE